MTKYISYYLGMVVYWFSMVYGWMLLSNQIFELELNWVEVIMGVAVGC